MISYKWSSLSRKFLITMKKDTSKVKQEVCGCVNLFIYLLNVVICGERGRILGESNSQKSSSACKSSERCDSRIRRTSYLRDVE